jgi:rfaE bifunctional protein kinase chain/domain
MMRASRLPVARAEELLRAMFGRRIFVLGDLMLDEFVWGRVTRISQEAPVPVVEIVEQSFRLGGAANVAANVRSLRGQPVLSGVVGRDAGGERMQKALAEQAITSRVVVHRGRPTTVKTRIIASGQQVVRTDVEKSSDVTGQVERTLLDTVRDELPTCKALVVSDYQKGAVTASLLRKAVALGRRRGVPVLVDPKLRETRFYRGVTVVRPNQREAERASGIALQTERDLLEAGRRLLTLLGCRALVITRGARGLALFEQGRSPLMVPSVAREVFDLTGAGDSVTATMAVALAAGANLREAAILANCAAGVVVGKLGTAQASPEEVLEAIRART